MSKLLIAVLLSSLAVLPACGKNKAVKAAEEMADEVCACKDVMCAASAAKKGQDKLMGMLNETGTESDAKAITEAASRMQDCVSKLASK